MLKQSLLYVLCLLAAISLSAQNISVTYQNPAHLSVCSTDQFEITVSNGNTAALTGIQVAVTFPAGIEYVPGTVSGATFASGNPVQPVFALANLAAGTSATFTITLHANCSLVAAINSGQLFSNQIALTSNNGSLQINTLSYPVETGLLLVEAVIPSAASGVQGQVISRQIRLRNTRQGPISSLTFKDVHAPGISLALQSISGQNVTNQLFTADVPGSYFTGFGDGDALLEVGEELILVEEVTVEACGDPSFTLTSLLIAGWGCDSNACQSDSATANVTVLPSVANPNLEVSAKLSLPTEACASAPFTQFVTVRNTGSGMASGASLLLSSPDSAYIEMIFNSFEVNAGNGWSSLTPVESITAILPNCAVYQCVSVKLLLPDIPAGDSLQLRFQSVFCAEICGAIRSSLRILYECPNICPPNTTKKGSILLAKNAGDLAFQTSVNFNIGACLEEDSVYHFTWWAKSKRLQTDTGYVTFRLIIPPNLFWVNNCIPMPEGKMPVHFELQAGPGTSTTALATYALPFVADSIFGDFCLTYVCTVNMPCDTDAESDPPSDVDITVAPPDADCGFGCRREVDVAAILTKNQGDNLNCGIAACDQFLLLLKATCGTPPPQDTTGFASRVLSKLDIYRTNFGLPDHNNDRIPEAGPLSDPLVRRDRFMTGDTVRTELNFFIVTGPVDFVTYRLFTESWASDMTTAGGDEYNIGEAKRGLVNFDSLVFLSGYLKIRQAATGATFTCSFDQPFSWSDRHKFVIAEPNIEPLVVLDQLVSMYEEYQFNLGALSCLPAGFELATGDSLQIVVDHRFKNNFTPKSPAAAPPLVNIRTSLCQPTIPYAWKKIYCYEPILTQFSGFRETITPPASDFFACTNSEEQSPLRYDIRLARENLFPHEVRPLVQVKDFFTDLPLGVQLVEAHLNKWYLQESLPLFTNETVNFTQVDTLARLDLTPFTQQPLDEGFGFEISQVFSPDCGHDSRDSAFTHLTLAYANDAMHDPAVFDTIMPDKNNYAQGGAYLQLIPSDTLVAVATSTVNLSFLLRNSATAPSYNTWLVVEADGNLEDVELRYQGSQQLVPLVAGVYQFGLLNPFQHAALYLTARNTSCASIKIHFKYGWNCTPVGPGDTTSCGQYETIIFLLPQKPELEIKVNAQPASVPMCAGSDFFEIEVYNANTGRAYGVQPSIKLPDGLVIIPGSSSFSYPAGSPFAVLPDPALEPGNIFRWNLPAAIDSLALHGLAEVTAAPLNAVRIRFRVEAACGFVANAQPVYGLEAVLPCGIASNSLRKPGVPIQLQGVTPSNIISPVLIQTDVSGAGCGAVATLSAMLQLNGAPGSGDSIYVLLPAGVSYVAGTYQPGANATFTPPVQQGGRLVWPWAPGLVSGMSVQFSFQVKFDDPAGCLDQIIRLQAREQATIFCQTTNQNCNVGIVTGEAILPLVFQTPQIVLKNFTVSAASGGLSYQAQVENAGAGTAIGPLVQFYVDENQNGVIDPADMLVGIAQSNQPLTAGSVWDIAGLLNANPELACHLLARAPAQENCACDDQVWALSGPATVKKELDVCGVIPVMAGVDSVAGNTYHWLAPGLNLSCTTCAHTVLYPDVNVQSGDQLTLVLEEDNGDCVVQYLFELHFGSPTNLELPDEIICQGDTLAVAVPSGISYQWSGPGITDPALAVQLLQPQANAVYQVTVTYVGGCTATGQLTVAVLESNDLDLGTKITCEGNPVDLWGVLTDQPGIYTHVFPKANGCDSTLRIQLVTLPSQTEETWMICRGDSVLVYDTWVKGNQSLCRTYTNILHCDSTHCINVLLMEPLLLPDTTSGPYKKGTRLQLDAFPGLAAYAWAPPGLVECPTCPAPFTTPDTTTVFTLTYTDDHGCQASVQYRVIIFPPCNPEAALRVPNAFSPNGDGLNDQFRVLPFEGLEVIDRLDIYNRWGELVFRGQGNQAAWDGAIDGKQAASDVYVWILEVSCEGEKTLLRGNVTLLR